MGRGSGLKPQLLLPAKRVWHRELRIEGRVTVTPGDTVTPESTLAESLTPAPPVVVELGQAQPLVEPGQEVQAGQVIARRKKLIGSGEEVHSPVTGKVLLVEGADLLLQPPPLSTTLEAQLPGVVAAVRTGWGADVEGCFGLLRGWAGSGPSCRGVLGETVAVVPEPLTVVRLQALASQGARAAIVPGWAEGEAPDPEATPQGPSLLLTEAIPGRPMAAPIAEALQRHLGRAAALSMARQAWLGFEAEAAEQDQCFGPGAWVRTADGRAGRLTHIGSKPRFFASGLRAVTAEVDLGDSTQTLPLDRLDWIA